MQLELHRQTRAAAPHAASILATLEGQRGRTPPSATKTTGLRMPIGSCSTASATARSWMSRSRPPS